MLLHVLIVIKQHSLISPETKVCILGSPCTCDIFFLSIRQRYRESPGPKTWTSWLKNLVPICLYCLKCTKFGQLILRKIIEIVATRCQILRLKCTKFNFGWVSAPDPAGGAYSAPRYPLAGFKGPTFEGREREGRGCEGARKVVCPGAALALGGLASNYGRWILLPVSYLLTVFEKSKSITKPNFVDISEI